MKGLLENYLLVESTTVTDSGADIGLKLVDAKTMSVVGLPESANRARWVSKNGYLYFVKEGGLKELGTWYQQISPWKKFRLSGKDNIMTNRDRYVLASKSQKIFINDGKYKPNWKAVDLKTEKISKLGQWDGIKHVCVVGASIELGSKSAGQSIFVSDTTVQE